MKQQEENKKLYRLIAECMGETESVEEDWQAWADITDHARVSSILREILSGALIAEGRCSEGEVENYINKLLTASAEKPVAC